jgi:hypothetical protein
MTYQTVEVLSEPTWEDVELSTLLGMNRMGEEALNFFYMGRNLAMAFRANIVSCAKQILIIFYFEII